ncbi:hypothetical protein [Aggregatibacter aphrophilus]|uniref:hypothetical protein n=1 Tax=Aggregatibacter aphrophilus TaxID=732 RepID=UPI000D647D63|nr:hypothetical protein [Aggregatibacter aphrophilus]
MKFLGLKSKNEYPDVINLDQVTIIKTEKNEDRTLKLTFNFVNGSIVTADSVTHDNYTQILDVIRRD